MIQQRRHSRKTNGSAKADKTFDKRNGINRIKDEDDELVTKLKSLDLSALIEEEMNNNHSTLVAEWQADFSG